MCPLCGTNVSANASECPNCGEAFSPVETGEVVEETVVEETEEIEQLAPAENLEVPVEAPDICGECGTETIDGKCPECEPSVPELQEASLGCPICGGRKFTVESGDLVSCGDCGNVYIRKEFEGPEQSWKWKFWVGLVFILIGDVGVALGSYIHNVFEWSPLGQPYLGYGWIDQAVGMVGIVLFILGLVLFAWSFKREREVQCPSCKVIIRESQFDEVEEEEEEVLPESVAVESALEEIGEMAECPACGAAVSIFDTECSNCGALFEMEIDYEEGVEETEIQEILPEKPVHGKDINHDELIMESLELETPEDESNGNSLEALSELESAFQVSMNGSTEGVKCPNCGATIGKGLDTCPGCGKEILPVKGGE